MLSIEEYKDKIYINLENGVYIFDDESATGKSRLCSLMKEYRGNGRLDIFGYTYIDRYDISFEQVFNKGKTKVVLLDRYDMYLGEAAEWISKYKNDMVILIDCKGEFKDIDVEDWDYCYIKMTVNSIEVSN